MGCRQIAVHPLSPYSSISTSRKQATEEAVPTDQVEVVLALSGFSYDGEWMHWPGPLHEVNPSSALWGAYDAIR